MHNHKLNKGQVITKSNLTRILNDARTSYNYAKFTLGNGTYFTITFNRDNTVEIATNNRDLALWTQIQSLKQSYSTLRAVDYIFNWINTYNK